jgi:hypothetical protein
MRLFLLDLEGFHTADINNNLQVDAFSWDISNPNGQPKFGVLTVTIESKRDSAPQLLADLASGRHIAFGTLETGVLAGGVFFPRSTFSFEELVLRDMNFMANEPTSVAEQSLSFTFSKFTLGDSTIELPAVPEPSTGTGLAMGMLWCLGWAVRRPKWS